MTSVDHKVAMLTLAQERRAAGKPVWERTVRGFRDILQRHDDDDVVQTRGDLVQVLKASSSTLGEKIDPVPKRELT